MNNCCIVMPTRNRPDFLRDSLKRLKAVGLGSLPLFVYDDASDDPAAVAAAVQETWPGACVVRGEIKRGQCHGRNTLLARCGHEFAILLDDDQYIINRGCLDALVDPARRDPTCAGVAFQSRDRADGRLDFPATLTARRSPFFMGGSILFHVPTFLAVGGYRPFWGYGYEEPELASRLYARGFHLWYTPEVLVEHNHVTHAGARRDETEYNHLYPRNAVLLTSLNMPLWIGLPLGLVRAWRRARTTRGYWGAKLHGIGSSFVILVRHWRERHPMNTSQALAWLRFNRSWMQDHA